jgi:hypothetical protein
MRRTTLVSSVPLLLTIGCEAGESTDDSFRVIELEFDGDATITLTFSQPLAELGTIDPNDFRISAGVTQSFSYDGMTYTMTNYRDLFSDSYPLDFGFVSLTAGPGPDQLVLQTSESIAEGVCDWLGVVAELEYDEMQDPTSRADGGMFLHYARGEIPIESDKGEALADIGRDWVLTEGLTLMVYDSYGFTQLHPQLRIPCS